MGLALRVVGCAFTLSREATQQAAQKRQLAVFKLRDKTESIIAITTNTGASTSKLGAGSESRGVRMYLVPRVNPISSKETPACCPQVAGPNRKHENHHAATSPTRLEADFECRVVRVYLVPRINPTSSTEAAACCYQVVGLKPKALLQSPQIAAHQHHSQKAWIWLYESYRARKPCPANQPNEHRNASFLFSSCGTKPKAWTSSPQNSGARIPCPANQPNEHRNASFLFSSCGTKPKAWTSSPQNSGARIPCPANQPNKQHKNASLLFSSCQTKPKA